MLELGAGGGLPGIVTVKNGAKSVSYLYIFDFEGVKLTLLIHSQVFLTDYPDTVLLENLKHNVQKNIAPEFLGRVHVEASKFAMILVRPLTPAF